jgi:hypothetical protein
VFSGIGGNDKINRITKGTNYGFPLTYGAGTATDAFGITTQPPVFTSGNSEVWAPEGIVAFNNSVFFCALGGLGNPPGTASLNQFTVSGTTPTSGITKRLSDGHRKRAATIGPDRLLYYSTSDGDGRGSQSAGTDVVNKIDLTVWAPSGPSPTPTPTPTPNPNQSPNNTVILAGSTAAIIDALGNKWTITSGAQLALNASGS